jgi:co-chaperonin GroES (HSP10)
MANVQPLGKHILLRPAEKPKEAEGENALSLAEGKKKSIDRPYKGTVLAVGPEVTLVSVGDVIYFDKYKLSDVEIDAGDLIGDILESDVCGKIV